MRQEVPKGRYLLGAPLWLTSVVAFLFSDKNVTLPLLNGRRKGGISPAGMDQNATPPGKL